MACRQGAEAKQVRSMKIVKVFDWLQFSVNNGVIDSCADRHRIIATPIEVHSVRIEKNLIENPGSIQVRGGVR